MTGILDGRAAIIHGGGGGIGGGVARVLAREGAAVCLAGRTRGPLDAVAREIAAAGGTAETAVPDALDERAVDAHVAEVAERHGGVHISFGLTGRGDGQGVTGRRA
jgi:NADP-dependent 3-hydroxy acid dehydrogenase YdfG